MLVMLVHTQTHAAAKLHAKSPVQGAFAAGEKQERYSQLFFQQIGDAEVLNLLCHIVCRGHDLDDVCSTALLLARNLKYAFCRGKLEQMG